MKPALALLGDPRFGAQDEFLSAHAQYRAGEYEDVVLDANRAFESTMKTICDIKGCEPPRHVVPRRGTLHHGRHMAYDYNGHTEEDRMREVQLRHAKAALSAVVDDAVRGEPSIITRHGKPQAVVIGFEDWQRLSNVPSFGRLLMSAPLESGDLPERDRAPLRDVDL